MSKKIIVTLLFILVFGGGFALARIMDNKKGLSSTASQENRPPGPRPQTIESSVPVIPPSANEPIGVSVGEVHTLGGTIQSIVGNTLTLSLSSANQSDRTVTIADTTKITETILKDQNVFEKELETYRYKVQNEGYQVPAGELPPQMTENKIVERSALQAGQKVRVTAAEDIKEKESFVALTIEVSHNPGP